MPTGPLNPINTGVTLNPSTAGAAPTPLSPTNPTISTSSPTVSVTVPNTSGTVAFQLVVTDNLGNKSAPAIVTVSVQGAPVAELQATPSSIGPGAAITLSAAGSTSQGSIATYTFSLVPQVQEPAEPPLNVTPGS